MNAESIWLGIGIAAVVVAVVMTAALGRARRLSDEASLLRVAQAIYARCPRIVGGVPVPWEGLSPAEQYALIGEAREAMGI